MARVTAQDVHTDLKSHEAQCSERWKTAFSKFDDLNNDIKNLQSDIGHIRDKFDNGSKVIISFLVALIASLITLIIRTFV